MLGGALLKTSYQSTTRTLAALPRSARLVCPVPPCEGARKASRKRQPHHYIALRTK